MTSYATKCGSKRPSGFRRMQVLGQPGSGLQSRLILKALFTVIVKERNLLIDRCPSSFRLGDVSEESNYEQLTEMVTVAQKRY